MVAVWGYCLVFKAFYLTLDGVLTWVSRISLVCAKVGPGGVFWDMESRGWDSLVLRPSLVSSRVGAVCLNVEHSKGIQSGLLDGL